MHKQIPFFSIVIPTYNRPGALLNCVESMLDLDYPRDRYEVIVVHDAPLCGMPADFVSAFREKATLTELCQDHAGSAAARNKGAAAAKGDYLAFTDDDCLVSPGWLRGMAKHLDQQPSSACAGRTINYHLRNRYSEASQMINEFVMSASAQMKSPFVTCNNLVVPTETFREIGGFDTAFPGAAGEDREFSVRWRSAGYSLDHVSEGLIYHAQNLNFRGFCRQQFGYGRAAFLLRGLLQQSSQQRVGLERMSFYLDLLCHPLRAGMNWKSFQLAAMMGVSQVVVALGFVREALCEPRVSSVLNQGWVRK